MPKKLAVVVILFLAAIGFSVQQKDYVAAVFSALLLGGVLKGNDGVRKFIIALAVVQILWAGVTLVQIVTLVGMSLPTLVLIYAAMNIGVPVYLLWVMSQADVREWMFRKAFNLDPDPIPAATARETTDNDPL